MNVSLLYNSEINNQSTTGFMRSWVDSTQTVTVVGDRLTVANDCPQLPTIPTTSSTGSTSVNFTAIIFSSIFGIPVLIILIVGSYSLSEKSRSPATAKQGK